MTLYFVQFAVSKILILAWVSYYRIVPLRASLATDWPRGNILNIGEAGTPRAVYISSALLCLCLMSLIWVSLTVLLLLLPRLGRDLNTGRDRRYQSRNNVKSCRVWTTLSHTTSPNNEWKINQDPRSLHLTPSISLFLSFVTISQQFHTFSHSPTLRIF